MTNHMRPAIPTDDPWLEAKVAEMVDSPRLWGTDLDARQFLREQLELARRRGGEESRDEIERLRGEVARLRRRLPQANKVLDFTSKSVGA